MVLHFPPATIEYVEGYNKEFLKLFGFGLPGVNYDEDVEIDVKIH